jgi:hypothetical protein
MNRSDGIRGINEFLDLIQMQKLSEFAESEKPFVQPVFDYKKAKSIYSFCRRHKTSELKK